MRGATLIESFLLEERQGGRLAPDLVAPSRACLGSFCAWAEALVPDGEWGRRPAALGAYRRHLQSAAIEAAEIEATMSLVLRFQRHWSRAGSAVHPPAPVAAGPPTPAVAEGADHGLLHLRRLVDRLRDLPTLPSVAAHVMEAVESPATTVRDVEQILSHDQALASKLLKVANSAYYSFGREIVTTRQAVTVLGFLTVKNLVLSASVLRTLGGRAGPGPFDPKAFWIHSVAVATAARLLADRIHPGGGEAAFLAGLLHDIGKAALYHALGAEYVAVVEHAFGQSRPIRDAETALLGGDHAQVGGWLLERWKIPPLTADPVRLHHRPVATGDGPGLLVGVVHIADCLARGAGIGQGGDPLVPEPDPEVVAALGLSEDALVDVVAQLSARKDEIVEFFEVVR